MCIGTCRVCNRIVHRDVCCVRYYRRKKKKKKNIATSIESRAARQFSTEYHIRYYYYYYFCIVIDYFECVCVCARARRHSDGKKLLTGQLRRTALVPTHDILTRSAIRGRGGKKKTQFIICNTGTRLSIISDFFFSRKAH